MSVKAAKSYLIKTRDNAYTLLSSSGTLLGNEALPDRRTEATKYIKGRVTAIKQRTHRLTMAKKNLQEALEKLAEAEANLDPEEQAAEEKNIGLQIEDTTTAIEIELLQQLEDINTVREDNHEDEGPENAVRTGRQQRLTYSESPQLPQVKLPMFSGKSWDWENFWQIFHHNIHNQPIPAVVKFNHLLGSLSGEVREKLGRFQVTETGYFEAIEWLKKRYGRDDVIIEQLYTKLENIQSTGDSTTAQRNLFDQVATTMTQLRNKGQDVDHRQLLSQVTRKFQFSIQDKIITRRAELLETNSWSWQSLCEVIEDTLSRRERIEEMRELAKGEKRAKEEPNSWLKKTSTKGFDSNCLFCKRTNHAATECREVPLNERFAFFKRNNLCLNCGRKNHMIAECRSSWCKQCGKKHHISLCGIKIGTSIQLEEGRKHQNQGSQPTERVKGNINQQKAQRGQRQESRMTTHSVQQNLVGTDHRATEQTSKQKPHEEERKEISEEEEAETQTLQIKRKDSSVREATYLLSGIVKIDGPDESREVGILLDTGSELSFIDSKLADDLKLPVTGKRTLRINTFGSNETKQDDYEEVKTEVRSIQDRPHKLNLFKSKIITKSKSQLHLKEEDWNYIRNNNIHVPCSSKPFSPQILLGCDQLWEVMSGSMIKLPSGLHLIATIFGYMVSGQQSGEEQTKPKAIALTMEEEKEKWDTYWTLESAGLQEFTGTEKQEKEETNRQVLENFNRTVVKAEDGYYVRLPWKENHDHLPDNRHIAERRLRSTFESHKEDKSFLQAYDKIFQDQLEKGILEEVTNPRKKGKRVHYLAHQAVITPKKTTTKMRVVFDASAHYKGRISLNDALHQGPLILPKIIGMIMRFRTGKIATSDVEKAFLQVRLHEEDRDATRCLWVRDIGQPLDEDNIVVYRFTRVTFGLKSLPFLLAATIRFHVEHEEVHEDLVEDITNNLYVDNLFMTAESTEEAIQKYHRAKELFDKINMNLREFVSNDRDFNNQLPEKDKSQEVNSSTLGITWNTQEDVFVVEHKNLEIPKITKRKVLSAMASVYDPIGFLIPLTIQSKLFFQQLWKKDYTWDAKLSQEDTTHWQRICRETKGFVKHLPRQIADKNTTHQLLIFTDASSEAMCAVIYLKNNYSQNILTAKSRLPSLKSKHTIPKLELNAITMGARLALNTVEEFRNQIKIDNLYILSDSEIALSWIKSNAKHREAGVLVRNRFKEIADISGNLSRRGMTLRFGYINTRSNPADLGTRGLSGNDFTDSIWWKGPDSRSWLQEETQLFSIEDTVAVNLTKVEKPYCWTEDKRFGSITKLKRTTARILRFIKKAMKNLPVQRKELMFRRIPELQHAQDEGRISGKEVRSAMKAIVRAHQNQFEDEFQKDNLSKLNVHADEEGILRFMVDWERAR